MDFRTEMIKYFEIYSSNTYAGSGNQLHFNMAEDEIRTGRVFYKISIPGEYNYSLLFSNIIDSTYEDGSKSRRNLICDTWKIHGARVGKCKNIDAAKDISKMSVADADEDIEADIIVSNLKDITFDGQKYKNVMPGEFFTSDAIKLDFGKGEYLCLEITFSGKMIPYHEESLLPVYVKENNDWKYSKQMPFAGMIGCDRKVKGRIGYFGDSITQGVGTQLNSYLHWNALLSEKIGDEYSFWNLGIGYGMANDAASNGAWLYKAKQNDIVFVCYGVNDILQGKTEEQIKSDLTYIVDVLKKDGKKVILQTVPPFDYIGENIEKWERINIYIKTVLKDRADFVFDNVPYLSGDCPQIAKFDGHPSEEGCAIWADALYKEVMGILTAAGSRMIM